MNLIATAMHHQAICELQSQSELWFPKTHCSYANLDLQQRTISVLQMLQTFDQPECAFALGGGEIRNVNFEFGTLQLETSGCKSAVVAPFDDALLVNVQIAGTLQLRNAAPDLALFFYKAAVELNIGSTVKSSLRLLINDVAQTPQDGNIAAADALNTELLKADFSKILKQSTQSGIDFTKVKIVPALQENSYVFNKTVFLRFQHYFEVQNLIGGSIAYSENGVQIYIKNDDFATYVSGGEYLYCNNARTLYFPKEKKCISACSKFLYFSVCVEACPENTIDSSGVCVNNAQGSVFDYSVKKFVACNNKIVNNTCLSQCGSGDRNFFKICVQTCPKGFAQDGTNCILGNCNGMQLQNGICGASCPNNQFINGNQCVQQCLDTTQLNRNCSTSCDQIIKPNGSFSVCSVFCIDSFLTPQYLCADQCNVGQETIVQPRKMCFGCQSLGLIWYRESGLCIKNSECRYFNQTTSQLELCEELGKPDCPYVYLNDSNNNICCKTCPEKTFLHEYSKICLKICPADAPFANASVCKTVCQFYNFDFANHAITPQKQFLFCVISCADYYFKNSSILLAGEAKQCISDCSLTGSMPLNPPTVGNECLRECADGTYKQKNPNGTFTCVTSCPLFNGYPLIDSSQTNCLSQCPVRHYLYSNSLNLFVCSSEASCDQLSFPFLDFAGKGGSCQITCPLNFSTFKSSQNQTMFCISDNCENVKTNTDFVSYNRIMSINSVNICYLKCPVSTGLLVDNGVNKCINFGQLSCEFNTIGSAGEFDCWSACPNNLPYVLSNSTCVAQCSGSEQFIDGSNKCLSKCPSGFYEIVGNDFRCRTNCPKFHFRNTSITELQFQCVDTCLNTGTSIFDPPFPGICLTRCQSSEVIKTTSNHKTCVLPKQCSGADSMIDVSQSKCIEKSSCPSFHFIYDFVRETFICASQTICSDPKVPFVNISGKIGGCTLQCQSSFYKYMDSATSARFCVDLNCTLVSAGTDFQPYQKHMIQLKHCYTSCLPGQIEKFQLCETRCSPGFEFIDGECVNFDCSRSEFSCGTYGQCTSDGSCVCMFDFIKFNETCLNPCYNLPSSQYLLQNPLNFGNISFGGVFRPETLVDYNSKDCCSLFNPSCQYVLNSIEHCRFSVSNQTLPGNSWTMVGCNFYYTGDYCDKCDVGAVEIQGKCYERHLDAHGDCGIFQNSIICNLCFEGYQGESCDQCEVSYISVLDQCHKLCMSCHGECYYDQNSQLLCNYCFENFTGLDCQDCMAPLVYKQELDQCVLKCTSCNQGVDCSYVQGILVCSQCSPTFVGISCDRCIPGYVMFNSQCYKIIDLANGTCFAYETQQGHYLCIACNVGFFMINSICPEQCKDEQCDKGLCYKDSAAIIQCIDCYLPYELFENQCHETVSKPGGICSITKCVCYPGYDVVKQCDICSSDAQQIDDLCYTKCIECNGDCYISYKFNVPNKYCNHCNVGHSLQSLCERCLPAYSSDISGKCIFCVAGSQSYAQIYASLLDKAQIVLFQVGGCYFKCVVCPQGECWHDVDNLICVACLTGYNPLSNCLNCLQGYGALGDYCLILIQNPNALGQCYEYNDDQVCNYCQIDMVGNLCEQCSSYFESINQVCFSKPHQLLGDLYIQMISNRHKQAQQAQVASLNNDSSFCLEATLILIENEALLTELICTKCSEELVLINDTCFVQTLPILSDNCFVDFYSNQVICSSCFEQYVGLQCSHCADNFLHCKTGCCRKDDSYDKIGFCFVEQDIGLICTACHRGYTLKDKQCEKVKPNLLPIILPIAIIIIAVLVVTLSFYLHYKFSRIKFEILYRHLSLYAIQGGVHFLCVVLTQIASASTGINELFVNQYNIYVSIMFLGSLPASVVFILFEKPKLQEFHIKQFEDLGLIICIPLLDLVFQAILYFVVPEQMKQSEYYYNTLAAPLALTMFIFAFGRQFKKSQTVMIGIAAAVPTLFVTYLIMVDCFSLHSFFSHMGVFQVLFIPIMAVVNVCIMVVQTYLLHVLIGRYNLMQLVLRIGFATNVIFGFLYFLDSRANVNVILYETTEILVPALIQMILPWMVVYASQLLTSLEVKVGISLTSYSFAMFVLSLGSTLVAKEYQVYGALQTLMLVGFSLLLLVSFFGGVVGFYLLENPVYHIGIKGFAFDEEEELNGPKVSLAQQAVDQTNRMAKNMHSFISPFLRHERVMSSTALLNLTSMRNSTASQSNLRMIHGGSILTTMDRQQSVLGTSMSRNVSKLSIRNDTSNAGDWLERQVEDVEVGSDTFDDEFEMVNRRLREKQGTLAEQTEILRQVAQTGGQFISAQPNQKAKCFDALMQVRLEEDGISMAEDEFVDI